MCVLYAHPLQESCRCAQTAAGSVVPEWTHLWFLSGEATGNAYEVCPYTGVVWFLSYGTDSDHSLFVYTHTGYTLPDLSERTAGVAQLTIDAEIRQRLYAPVSGALPPVPVFPLRGVLYCWARGDAYWRVNPWIEQKGRLTLGIWVHIPYDLGVGEQGEVWVASPLEPITQQALCEGRQLRLLDYKGFLGQLQIRSQYRLTAEEFKVQFAFDPATKMV